MIRMLAMRAHATLFANVGRNALQRHDSRRAGVLRDLRLFSVRHVHDDAAFQHLGQANLETELLGKVHRDVTSVTREAAKSCGSRPGKPALENLQRVAEADASPDLRGEGFEKRQIVAIQRVARVEDVHRKHVQLVRLGDRVRTLQVHHGIPGSGAFRW